MASGRPQIPKQNHAGPTTPVFVSQGNSPTPGVGKPKAMPWAKVGKKSGTTINTARTSSGKGK